MARFTLPRDLYHGKGALEALKTLKGKKASDSSIRLSPTSKRRAWKCSSLRASSPILPSRRS